MKFDKILQILKQEWERTILACIAIIGIIGLGLGLYRFLEFFSNEVVEAPGKVRKKELFMPQAFDFLDRKNIISMTDQHPLDVQIPKDWLATLRRKQILKDREARRKRIADQRAQNNKAGKNGNNGRRPNGQPRKPGAKGPGGGADGETGDQEPTTYATIVHFLVFKGFYQPENGERMVYLGLLDKQEEVSQKQGALFLHRGEEFEGFTVVEADDEMLVVKDSRGKKLELEYSEPFEIKRTENPTYQLEVEEEEKEDAEAESKPTPKKPKTASKKKKDDKLDLDKIRKSLPQDIQDQLPPGITERDIKKYVDLFGEDRARDFLKNKGLDPGLLNKFIKK